MSNFNCEQCGCPIIEEDGKYITACKHYPFDILNKEDLTQTIQFNLLNLEVILPRKK